MTPSTGWMVPGAATMPVSAVNTTSDMTRGFSSSMKSPMPDPVTGPIWPLLVSALVPCISLDPWPRIGLPS